MKLYKSPDNKVYAFEEDGSQDHLIWKNFVAITEEEAQEIIKAMPPPELPLKMPTKEERIATLQAELDALKG